MADYPIFEEIKNFIYTNLESIFLVITPLAAIIGFLSERINKRLTSIETGGLDAIKELKKEIKELGEELNEHKENYNQYKLESSKAIGILKALLMRDYDFGDDADDQLNMDNLKKLKRKRRGSNSV